MSRRVEEESRDDCVTIIPAPAKENEFGYAGRNTTSDALTSAFFTNKW